MQSVTVSPKVASEKLRFSPEILFVVLLILALSGISTFLIFFDIDRPDHFYWLFTLPLSFMICSIVFIKVFIYLFKAIGFTLFMGLVFFRYSVIPLTMYLGNYKSLMVNTVGFNYASNGILVMIWELIILFLFLFIIGGKFYNISDKKNKTIDNLNTLSPLRGIFKKKVKLKFFTVIGIIAIISCFIIYPELRYYYFSYFFSSEEQITMWSMNSDNILNGVPSIISEFVIFWVDIVKYFVFLYVLLIINNKFKGTKYSFVPISLSLFVIVINMIIMTPNIAINIYISIVFLIVLKNYYPRQGNRILKVSFILIGVISIYILTTKSLMGGSTITETNPFENITSGFQSYFAGPSNVTTSVYMAETTNYNGLQIFIVDILKQTPVIQFFFQGIDTPTSPILFNEALYGHSERKDQIIPLTGQGYLYFGLFFAPILSVFVLYISMFFDKAIINYKNNHLLAFYLLGTIIAVFSINVYNFGIFIRLMIQYVIPLYILIKFNTRGLNQLKQE